jgi:chemotaxis protein MotB
MSRRKRGEEEHVNLERWLVSYADFITLLFAFFVVMYSISSINESKYRVLSQALVAVFNPSQGRSAAKTLEPLSEGELNPGENLITLIPPDHSPSEPETKTDDAMKEEQAQLDRIASQIEAVLAPYIQDDLVTIRREKLWVELEMKSGLFFSSGSSALSKESLPILYRLAQILVNIDNVIHVEGHTDNVPIRTLEFPSNWALSSARAASVVQQLVENGLDPRRMVAIGYGEYHPVEDNQTEAGRNKNRRVVLIIMSDQATRYKLSTGEHRDVSPSPKEEQPANVKPSGAIKSP